MTCVVFSAAKSGLRTLGGADCKMSGVWAAIPRLARALVT